MISSVWGINVVAKKMRKCVNIQILGKHCLHILMNSEMVVKHDYLQPCIKIKTSNNLKI